MKNAMTRQNPWRALRTFENEVDRWLHGRLPDVTEFEGGFLPSAELKDRGSDYLLKVDIPGVRKEDIKIEAEDNRISISGERSSEKEEKNSKHYLSETSYGSFMRAFTLPDAVKTEKIEAKYANGVLELVIPKNTEQLAKKTIAIQ